MPSDFLWIFVLCGGMEDEDVGSQKHCVNSSLDSALNMCSVTKPLLFLMWMTFSVIFWMFWKPEQRSPQKTICWHSCWNALVCPRATTLLPTDLFNFQCAALYLNGVGRSDWFQGYLKLCPRLFRLHNRNIYIFFFGSCAVTCHHSWCCFYTAFVWGWANISRRWLLRTAFPWPCDSFNLGCVVFSRACPEVAENAWVQDRAERDPSSLKMVASFALYSQYPRPVPVTISSASYLQTS